MLIFVGIADRNFVTVFIPLPSIIVAYPHAQDAVCAPLHQPNRLVNPFGQEMSMFSLILDMRPNHQYRNVNQVFSI
jgi:hypothetical protein